MSAESIPRYPLEWPVGWVQTLPHRRQVARFSKRVTVTGESGSWSRLKELSIEQATQRLEQEIERLGGRHPVLSTNVSLRLDGRPRSNETPRDPGAALYFDFKGKATVFACDRFTRLADNLAAIAGHIAALRAVERYGVGSLEQALSGYKALPADTAANWRAVFGFKDEQAVSVDALDSAYYTRAKTAHPDTGGSHDAMAHLNRARDYARMELGG